MKDLGFYFEVSADEARAHFTERAMWHDKKAADTERQMGALSDSLNEIRKNHGINASMSNTAQLAESPIDQLKDRIKERKLAAQKFQFLALHVPKGVTFKVSGGDLAQYEFGIGENDEPESRFGRLRC